MALSPSVCMESGILHFDNVREAQELTAPQLDLTGLAGPAFGVRLTARDCWLKAEGPPESVRKALAFFEGLRRVRDHGLSLGRQSVQYALEMFSSGREDVFERLAAIQIEVSSRVKPVWPRTLGQQVYLEKMQQSAITFGTGPAGTGKTYLAMACAVSALLREEVTRIILTRPAVEAGEALGFLPGDLKEKINPYLRPLYDALYDMLTPEEAERFHQKGMIEVAPLAYMRGRTLNHAFIILDEAQNTTPEQMLMFLTRMGFDSKCVVTGDTTQVDLPRGRQSGLIEAVDLLAPIGEIAFCELSEEDVVRHPIVQQVIRAYRNRVVSGKDGGNEETG